MTVGIYSEGNLDRAIILVSNGDGTWSPAEDNADPMATIVRRFGKADVTGATAVTASTTLYTPASGNAIRLKWIAFDQNRGASDTVVTIQIGTNDTYKWGLSSPGAFMRTSVREGAANEALSIVLGTPGPTVYVNYELDEFQP